MSTNTFTIPDTMPAPEPVTFSDAVPGDPDAPYGRLANGKPRKTPPKAKAAASGPKTAPAPKPGPPKAPGGARKAVDYKPVVRKAADTLSLLLIAAAGRTKSRAFLADAATVQLRKEDTARVVSDMAQLNPALARALAASAPAVPYIEAGALLLGLAAQFAANHGLALPPLPGLAVENPEHLAAGMESQLRTQATQTEAEAQMQARADADAEFMAEAQAYEEWRRVERDAVNAPDGAAADAGFAH